MGIDASWLRDGIYLLFTIGGVVFTAGKLIGKMNILEESHKKLEGGQGELTGSINKLTNEMTELRTAVIGIDGNNGLRSVIKDCQRRIEVLEARAARKRRPA